MSPIIRALVIAASLFAASNGAEAVVVGSQTSATGSSPPDCTGAAASLGVIWPPDHKMVAITIVGVTDPSGEQPFTIMVTGIQQDESVDALGSGNTQPDGAGVGTATALVRAERAGPGTGRIYYVSFTATNTGGASCTGTVSTFVPHDQGQGFTPVDTGLRLDSTSVTY